MRGGRENLCFIVRAFGTAWGVRFAQPHRTQAGGSLVCVSSRYVELNLTAQQPVFLVFVSAHDAYDLRFASIIRMMSLFSFLVLGVCLRSGWGAPLRSAPVALRCAPRPLVHVGRFAALAPR